MLSGYKHNTVWLVVPKKPKRKNMGQAYTSSNIMYDEQKNKNSLYKHMRGFLATILLLLFFQLVFNFLRFIVLYQPQDILVFHHTLDEFSL